MQAIDKRKLAMETWHAPIVITTAVHRKPHNIADSVVVVRNQ